MKKNILLLMLVAFITTSQAQNVDSLFNIYKETKDDSIKVSMLDKIARVYQNNNADSAMFYLKIMESVLNKTKDKKGLIRYNLFLVGIFLNKGLSDSALLYGKKATELAEKIGDKKFMAYAYNAVGGSFQTSYELDSAIFYYTKSLDINKSIDNKLGMLVQYGNISGLYIELKELEKAKAFALKGVELHNQKIGTDNDYIYLTANLAAYYKNLKKYDSALIYTEITISGSRSEKNYALLLANLQNKFEIKIAQQKYSELTSIIVDIESLGTELNSSDFNARKNLNKSINNYYNGKTNEAKLLGLEAIKICKENDFINLMRKAAINMSNIECKLGNYELSDKYFEMQDSLNQLQLNEEVSLKVKSIEAKYENQKKETEIYKLNAINKQKTNLNKILFSSAIGLILFSLLGYRNFKNKQKVSAQQQELQKQKIAELEKDKQLLAIDAMLQGQEEERSRIAKDLHDGLGGMLSGTKLSFINMKENLVLTPENATQFDKSLSMLDNTIADLRKVAHNLMPEALVKFGLQEAVRDFCNSIQSSTNLKVVYQPLGDNRKLSNTAEVFTYRIIQELVNNAVKHANASQIIVQLTTNNNKIGIAVEDDGKGYDVNALANSKGAGMDNIKYRVQYFNGTIDTVTSAGNGTSVNIELVV
jgi:two-component system, NarL family, sensor kinase